MLIAIIQRHLPDYKDSSAHLPASENSYDSILAAVENRANAIILRGFEGRYHEMKKLFETIRRPSEEIKTDTKRLNVKLLVNALPDEQWTALEPDGFHLNRHNVKIVLERPAIIDLLRNRAGLLGASVHNNDEMDRALLLHDKISLSYILISPVFKPSYDKMAVELGIDGFKKLYDKLTEHFETKNMAIPCLRPKAVALGGINDKSYRLLLPHAFIEGVAVMSAAGTLADEAVLRWSKHS